MYPSYALVEFNLLLDCLHSESRSSSTQTFMLYTIFTITISLFVLLLHFQHVLYI